MPPLLYLVRHAHAGHAADDAARRLTERGHAEVRALAALLRPAGAFRPATVWHSPLVRAQETAELLIRELRLKPTWAAQAALVPEANPQAIADLVADVDLPLALFGHEPHLGALASLLVAGETAPVVFAFEKTTTLALEPVGARWCVRWQVAPDLFA